MVLTWRRSWRAPVPWVPPGGRTPCAAGAKAEWPHDDGDFLRVCRTRGQATPDATGSCGPCSRAERSRQRRPARCARL
jgi:hypothetical protein